MFAKFTEKWASPPLSCKLHSRGTLAGRRRFYAGDGLRKKSAVIWLSRAVMPSARRAGDHHTSHTVFADTSGGDKQTVVKSERDSLQPAEIAIPVPPSTVRIGVL